MGRCETLHFFYFCSCWICHKLFYIETKKWSFALWINCKENNCSFQFNSLHLWWSLTNLISSRNEETGQTETDIFAHGVVYIAIKSFYGESCKFKNMFRKIGSPLHFRVVDNYNGGSNGIQLLNMLCKSTPKNCISYSSVLFSFPTNMSHPLFTATWPGKGILCH